MWAAAVGFIPAQIPVRWREIHTADYEAAPHMLSQTLAVLPGHKSKSGVQPIINSSRWGSFSIFYDTNGEKYLANLMLAEIEKGMKKSGGKDFCTCMKTIIFLISVPNAMVLRWRNKRPADKKGSDGLIHQYYSTMSGNTLPDFLKGEKGQIKHQFLGFLHENR